MEYLLYHATNKVNADKIKDEGFCPKPEIRFPLVKREGANSRMISRVKKKPRSLGYGFYFFSSKVLAELYRKEKMSAEGSCILTVSLVLDDNQEKYILDLTDEETLDYFLEYKERIVSQPNYKDLEKVFRNDNQSSLEGALVEHFIKDVINAQSTSQHAILVKAMTVSQIKGSNRSYVANGFEYCIRDNQVLKTVSLM